MKIVHVTARYFPRMGGVESFTKELCEKLSEKGFETVVYSLDLGRAHYSRETINGVLVKRYRAVWGDPFFLPSPVFIRDLRKENPAILHVHNLQNLFPLFVSLFKKPKQFFVLQPHYHRYGQTITRHLLLTLYKLFVPKLIINRAEIIVANSNFEEKMLKKDFSNSENILTVQEGIPLTELSAIKWSPEFPERILYIGALKKYKKVDILLKAFKIVLSYEKDLIKLIIVGDGPEKSNLVKLSDELGISEFIEWKSNLDRPQILSEYSKARVFVLLSLLESFSRVVHEAVIIGVPTVVSKSEVFSELIDKGLVDVTLSERPQLVAEAILKAKKRVLGLRKKENLRLYDNEEYSDRIASIYRSLESRSRQ
jgi:glycosyltransferase involved in cell wall biosynthesis